MPQEPQVSDNLSLSHTGDALAVQPVESISRSGQPIFYYKQQENHELRQLVIDELGQISDEHAVSHGRRSRSFVEISGDVEVTPIDGRAIVITPPNIRRATGVKERWIEITIGEGDEKESLLLPPDMLIDGFLAGSTVAEVLGRNKENRMIHTLVLPGPVDTAQVTRHGGRRIQTETSLPTVVMVFNPKQQAGVNWQEDSTQMITDFENEVATQIIASLSREDPKRKELTRLLALQMNPSLVADDVSGVDRERFFTLLRQAVPRQFETRPLTESHAQLPVMQNGRRLQFGTEGVVDLLDTPTRESLELAVIRFRDAIESGFLDNREIEHFINMFGDNLQAIHQELMESNEPNSEKMGFSVETGYTYLASGLRRLVAEYNDAVGKVVRERFHPRLLLEGGASFRQLQEDGQKVRAAETAYAESSARQEQLQAQHQETSSIPWWQRRPFTSKVKELQHGIQQIGEALRSQGIDLHEAKQDHERSGKVLVGKIDGVSAEAEVFFSKADPTRDEERRTQLRAEYEDLRVKDLQGISVDQERMRQVVDELQEIEYQTYDPETRRLRDLRERVETVKRYMQMYGRVAMSHGSEYGMSYAGIPKRAELLTMSDQSSQNMLVVCEFIGRMWDVEVAYRQIRRSSNQPFGLWPTHWEVAPREISLEHSDDNSITPENHAYAYPLGPDAAQSGYYDISGVRNVIKAWAEYRPLEDGISRTVLLTEYQRRADYLGLPETASQFDLAMLSTSSWLRESFAQTLAICAIDAPAGHTVEQMGELRKAGVMTPPLGMILESLDRKEIPVVAMAVRELIDNRGFMFTDKQQYSDPKHVQRNNELAEVARYLAGILQRTIPDIDMNALESNLAKFTDSQLGSRTPQQLYDGVKKLIQPF